MDSLVGTLASVDNVPAGGVTRQAHAAGETMLLLEDAADFPEDTGHVEVDGTVLAYDYADLGSDTLHLTDPLPTALPEGWEVRVYPLAETRVAVVAMDGAREGLQARIPQALLDQVPTSLRGLEDAESVRIEIVDGKWTVTDLIAVPSRAVDPELVAGLEQSLADAAQEIADTGAALDAHQAAAAQRFLDAEAALAAAQATLDDLDQTTLPGLRQDLDAAEAALATAFGGGDAFDLGAALAGVEDRARAGSSRIWGPSDEPPPSGTVYRWTGTPGASASEKLLDGAVVATNYVPTPSMYGAPDDVFLWSVGNAVESKEYVDGKRCVRATHPANAAASTPYLLLGSFPVGGSGPMRVVADVWAFTQAAAKATTLEIRWRDSAGAELRRDDVAALPESVPGEVVSATADFTVTPPVGATQAVLIHYWKGFVTGLVEGDYLQLAEVGVIAGGADYFDGDSPDDRARDLWIGPGNVYHAWDSTANGWVPASDEAIAAAQAAAEAAQEEAENTPRPHQSPNAPTPQDIMPAGSRWEQTDGTGPDAPVIGIWVQTQAPTGGAWAQRALGLSLLRADEAVIDNAVINSLTARIATVIELAAEQITTGQLDAARINVQALAVALADIIEARVENLTVTQGATIREAVIEALWAQVVRAHKITTDMLLVGSGENVVPDPYLLDPDLSSARLSASTGPWTVVQDAGENIASVGVGSQVFRWTAAPGQSAERFFPVTHGGMFRIRYDHRSSSTVGVQPRVRPGIRWQTADGTAATVYPRAATVDSTLDWQTDEVEWTVPDGAVGAYVQVDATVPTGKTLDVRRPQATAGASVLVDGIVKARHLDVLSVAAALVEAIEVRAENILAGTIEALLNIAAGGEITAGDVAAGGQAYLNHTGLGYRVPGLDGGPAATVAEFGRDWISRDSTGEVTASIVGEEGSIAGRSGDFASLSVGGVDVSDSLAAGPSLALDDDTGIVIKGPYTQETGYREYGFTAQPGHAYRLEVTLHVIAPTDAGGTHYTYVRATGAPLGGTPGAPTYRNTAQTSDDGSLSAGSEGRFYMTYVFTYAAGQELRFLTTARKGGANGTGFKIVRQRTNIFDMGLYQPQVTSGRWSLGDAPGTPTPDPTPPSQKYTRWWDFDWGQVYNPFGKTSAGTNVMRQGRTGPGTYSTHPFATLLRVPDAARSALMGASRVKVWVQATNVGWVTGDVIAGYSTSTSAPTQMPTVNAPASVGRMARGSTKRLLTPWDTEWKNGTIRSVTLGRVTGSGYDDRMIDFPLTGSHKTRLRLYAEWEV